nr:hypothetical protein [Belnapia arida]
MLAAIGPLGAKGIALWVPFMGGSRADSRTRTGPLMLTILGLVAELERQRVGIEVRAEGEYQGRPSAQRQAAAVWKLRIEGMRPVEIAARLGTGWASVYRVLKGSVPNVEASIMALRSAPIVMLPCVS